MKNPSIGPTGIVLISTFLVLLSFAGYLAYKSIDWTILTRLESQTLVLPTPIPATSPSASPSATIVTPTTAR